MPVKRNCRSTGREKSFYKKEKHWKAEIPVRKALPLFVMTSPTPFRYNIALETRTNCNTKKFAPTITVPSRSHWKPPLLLLHLSNDQPSDPNYQNPTPTFLPPWKNLPL